MQNFFLHPISATATSKAAPRRLPAARPVHSFDKWPLQGNAVQCNAVQISYVCVCASCSDGVHLLRFAMCIFDDEVYFFLLASQREISSARSPMEFACCFCLKRTETHKHTQKSARMQSFYCVLAKLSKRRRRRPTSRRERMVNCY